VGSWDKARPSALGNLLLNRDTYASFTNNNILKYERFFAKYFARTCKYFIVSAMCKKRKKSRINLYFSTKFYFNIEFYFTQVT
jgi:hypothetical protein